MPWQQLFYIFALVLAALTSGALALYIWQRRHTPGAMSIVVLMAAATLWSIAYALQLASVELASEIFFAKMEYFGIVVIPVAGLAFALQYSGRGQWLTLRNIALLSVIPVITLILVWTNESHELIWQNVRLENVEGFSVKVSEYGAWFVVFFAYAYVLMLIGTSLMITMIISSHDLYRRQAAALLIFALTPMISNTLYVTGLNPVPRLDLTPFAFNISGLALAWGLFRFRLADLIPVAYSTIIESMNDGIIVLDSQKRIIELNPAAKQLMGKSFSNGIGQPLEEAFPELANKLDLSRLEPSDDDAMPSVEIALGEEGAQRIYDVRMSRSADQLGRLTCRVITLRETTQHIQAEQKIRRQHQFLQNVLESLTHPFYVVNVEDYTVELANSAAHSSGPIGGLTCYALGHRRDDRCDPNEYPCPLQEVKNTKKAATMEHVHYDKDGNPGHYEVHGYPIFDDDGNVIQMIEYCLDITERKQMEEELRASEEKYRGIFESIVDVYGEVALDGTILEASPSIKEIGGYSREELIGTSLLDHHVNPQNRTEVIEELLQKGSVKEWEFQLRHKDGHIITFSFNVELVRDEDGAPKKTRGIMRDITERKRMEEELRKHGETLERNVRERTAELQEAVDQLQREIAERRKAEQKYRALIDVTGDNVYELDENLAYTYMSPMSTTLTGYTPEEHIGKTVFDFAPPDEAERLSAIAKDIIGSGQPLRDFESIALHRDGRRIFLESNALPLADDNGNISGYLVVDRDVSDRKRMEEELRRSEEKYRSMFWEAPDIFFILDLETMIIMDANKYALESLEYGQEEMGKIDITRIIHPDDFEHASKRLRDMVISKDRMPNFPLRVVTRTGKVRHIEQSGVVFWDADGNAKSFMGLAHDVTERKAAEEALRLSEERYRRILDTSHDSISIAGENAGILYGNKAHCEELGCTVEDVNTLGPLTFIHEEDQEKAVDWFQRAMNGESIRNAEYRRVRKNGDVRWIIANIDPIVWPGVGKTIVIIGRDISERKRAEEARRLSEERYHLILDSCHDMVSIIDENVNLLFANKSVYENTGYSPDDIERMNGYDSIHPDDRERVAQAFVSVLNGEPARGFEYRGIHKSGETRWVESNADLIYWDEGQKAVVNVLRDITDRKQAEEARRFLEERHQRILDNLHDMVVVVDESAELLFANRSVHELTGYSIKDIEAIDNFDSIHHEDRERIINTFLSVLNGEPAHSVEFRGIHKSGETRWVESNADLIYWDEGQKAVVNVLRDITDRKEAEEEIRLSKERYERILNSSYDNIFVFDQGGTVVFANRTWHEDTGYTSDEVIGRTGFNIIHPDDLGTVGEVVLKMLSGEAVRNLQYRRINKNGDVRWIESNAGPIDWPGADNAIVSVTRDVTERRQAEEQIRLSKERYENILDACRNNIVVMNEDIRPLYVNKSWEEDTGYTIDDFEDLPFSDITHPDDLEEVAKGYLRVLGGKFLENVEYRRIHKDGEIRWMESNASLIDWPGAERAVVNVSADITERKRSERALKHSLSLLSATLESTADGILVTDLKGNITSFNQRLLEMWRIPKHIVASGDQRRVLSFVRKQLAESEEFVGRVEKTQQRADSEGFELINFKDGRIFEQHSRPQKVGDIIVGQVLSFRDITERRHMQEALQKSEEKYRSVFEQAADSILLIDANTGAILDFNERAHENLGYTREEFEKIRMPDIEALESKDEIVEHIKKVRETGEDVFETKHRTKRGEIRDVRVNCRLVKTGGQQIFQSIWRDITESKRAEEEIRKSREQLENIIETMTEGLALIDAEGQIARVNPMAEQFLGLPRNEIEGLNYFGLQWEIFRPDGTHMPREERAVQRAITEKQPVKNVELGVKRPDGLIRWVNFSAAPLFGGAGKLEGIVGTFVDITDRKRAEEALRESEERQRALLNACTDTALFLIDPNGNFLTLNSALAQRLGNSVEKLIGKSIYDIPDPEVMKIRKIKIDSAFQSGKPLRFEDERAGIAFDNNLYPILDSDGKVTQLAVYARDITEQRRAEMELKNSRQQLRELSLHLESLREQERTRIARDIHDELGQALTALKMDAFWLAKRLPENQDPLVEKIRAMSDLIDATIKSMKRLSTELRPGLLDDLGLASAIEWQAEEFQRHMEIECRTIIVPKNISPDRERSTALFRIFQEALTNIGRHARATKVTAELEEIDGRLKLTVRDNGRGITKSEMTKAGAFGLVGIRERVTALKGEMRISGRKGKGTTLTVVVPIEG